MGGISITSHPMCIGDACGGFTHLLSITVHSTHADEMCNSEGTCTEYKALVVILRIRLGMSVELNVMS